MPHSAMFGVCVDAIRRQQQDLGRALLVCRLFSDALLADPAVNPKVAEMKEQHASRYQRSGAGYCSRYSAFDLDVYSSAGSVMLNMVAMMNVVSMIALEF